MGEARHRGALVHVLVGITGGVLLLTMVALEWRHWAARVPWLALLSVLWGLAYWLALSTPPRRQALNAVLALAAIIAGLLSLPVGLVALGLVWAIRSESLSQEAQGKSARPAGATTPPERQARQGSEPIAFPELVESELLPFLSPAGWSPQQDMACERLIAEYDNSPLVCLGWDSPRLVVIGGVQLLTPQNKATALANLRTRPNRPEWHETSMDLPDGSAEVFVRLGDVMTASDLWDPEFVRHAHLLAGSERVYFGVPTRQSMVMATSPEPVARLAMSRVEDDEHGEFVIGAEIISFDGDEFVVMAPLLDGDDRAVRH